MRKRSSLAGWLLGVPPLVLAAGHALAASEVGQTTAEIVHEAEHQSGGMPQLDASTYASQILWLVLSFIALYYLLRTRALPRVADILEARQERISNDLDKAAALRAEAEAAFEQHEEVIAAAQAKSQAEIKAAREAIAQDIAGRAATLDRDLSARIIAAEKTVAAARDKALGELEAVAVEVAQAATERLIGVKVDADEARAALAVVRQEVA